ncbi:KH domain-containing protein [Borreliella tanukii]|uniref:KH domain-containing protein n=1 Tax=Borreliella tanukii TaxID=56146 RepID=UPI00264902ED|nr:KH domain-containing protein [Borreliella tanukii]WKC81898.1 KH domain-containing protein [Borreliella tanukii]
MKEYGNEIELIEFVVKSLVDKQDEVKLNVIEGEKSTILELRVSQSDVGKIIGIRGRIARAIRTLLGACAAKTNRRVQLEILD